MSSRINIINNLIRKKNYKTYLEIGVHIRKNCFDKIICQNKICVDPSSFDKYDFNMTSDDFFKINKQKFDIVFIDGLHLAEQVEKDICNSLEILNDNGSLVVHDTNPPTELHCTEEKYNSDQNPTAYPAWNGTVWKAIFRLRSTRDDLVFKTYMHDWGVTIITRGQGKLLKLNNPYFSYHIFSKNRIEILNTYRFDFV